jgi:alpha-mannosidase
MNIQVCGATHIDLAWKMDADESAKFFQVFLEELLSVLDNSPGYTYAVEQASHYRRLNQTRPDLIDRLKNHIQNGAVEFVGGMASTADTNGPDGECLVRNLLLGRRWVASHLGAEVRTGWLIDTFGMSAQMPQVFRQLGVRHVMANRLGGEQQHDAFLAEGLDGSRVLVLGRDAAAPDVRRKHIFFQFNQEESDIDELFRRAGKSAEAEDPLIVMPYTEYESLPSLRVPQLMNAGGSEGINWRPVLPADFFEALDGTAKEWPIVPSDLNPEFTGTYSSRVGIRYACRRAEVSLLEAEKWAALSGANIDLTESWWKLFFVHSHDVYTGSHPTRVFQYTMNALQDIEDHAGAGLEDAAAALLSVRMDKTRVVVLNGLPWDRCEEIEVEGPGRVQVSVPAGGYRVINMAPTPGLGHAPEECEAGSIENNWILVQGSIAEGTNITLKQPERLVAIESAPGFLTIEQDNGNFQIEEPGPGRVMARASRIRVDAGDNARQTLELSGYSTDLGWAGKDASLGWSIEFALFPGKPRVEMKVRLEWKGEASRIRLRIPTMLEDPEAVYEIPFGTVSRQRYAHRGTARGEWPARRFVVLQGKANGLGVVNTGTHGAETDGGTILSTLLRAPAVDFVGMKPDNTSSQHGTHEFRFAIVPFAGHWTESTVLQDAQELNSPLRLLRCASAAPTGAGQSLFSLAGETVVLSSVKSATDGSGELILRMYETAGVDANAILRLKGVEDAWESDLNESKESRVSCKNGEIKLSFRPFEIKTLRGRTSG